LEDEGISNLRHADYTKQLAGKTIKTVRWFNDSTENFRNLTITFTDKTQVSFRFMLDLEEVVEMADVKEGNLSHERLLQPEPVKRSQ